MTDIPRPWDKRPDESEKAYHVFTAYLALGPDRSHEKVRQKLGKSSGYTRQIEKWSSPFEWSKRAAAYDAAQRAETEQIQSDLRRKLLEEELNDGQLLLTKWRGLMNEAMLLTERIETEDKTQVVFVEANIPGYIGLAKLRREIGDQLRRAIGLPERITQSQHTGENGGPVEVNGTQTHRVDDLTELYQKMAEQDKERRDAARSRRPSSPISE